MRGNDGLIVSVSQLKEFLICPRRYELHRVLAVEPAFVPVPLALGVATHAAIAALYSAVQARQEVCSADEAIQVFRDAWSATVDGPIPLKLDEDEADPVDTGVRMVEAFHRQVSAAGPVKVVAVEMPFDGVQLHDPATGEVLDERLAGVFDLVIEEERKVVVEHKSAARKWSRDQLEHDFQLTAYKVASRAIGLGEVGLRLQVVTKTKLAALQVEDVSRDELAEVDFLRTATGMLRAIGAGAFWPVRSWACRSCQYAHACSGGGVDRR